MTVSQKILSVIGIVLLVWLVVLVTFGLCMPKTFNGYYLVNGDIWASFEWAIDFRAGEHNTERWERILEHDLHLEKEPP